MKYVSGQYRPRGVVDAWQYRNSIACEFPDWLPHGAIEEDGKLKIPGLSGAVYVGDWLICYPDGAIELADGDKFQRHFEPAEGDRYADYLEAVLAVFIATRCGDSKIMIPRWQIAGALAFSGLSFETHQDDEIVTVHSNEEAKKVAA